MEGKDEKCGYLKEPRIQPCGSVAVSRKGKGKVGDLQEFNRIYYLANLKTRGKTSAGKKVQRGASENGSKGKCHREEEAMD